MKGKVSAKSLQPKKSGRKRSEGNWEGTTSEVIDEKPEEYDVLLAKWKKYYQVGGDELLLLLCQVLLGLRTDHWN